MYAVIKSGGKQHRVEEGEQLKLEKIEAAMGETIEFDEVLMGGAGCDVKIGSPLVEGGKALSDLAVADQPQMPGKEDAHGADGSVVDRAQ